MPPVGDDDIRIIASLQDEATKELRDLNNVVQGFAKKFGTEFREAAAATEKLTQATRKVKDASRQAYTATDARREAVRRLRRELNEQKIAEQRLLVAQRAGINLEKEKAAVVKQTNEALKFAKNIVGPTAAILATRQFLQGAVRNAREFGKVMAEVSTLVDTSKVNMDELTRSVRALAAAQGANEEIVGRGLYQAISSGISDVGEALAFLEQANKLAVAGVASTSDAVNLLTTALNAYGLSAENTERLSDILFKTVEQGKTTIPELAGAMGQVIPIAAALGVQIDEVAAAIATLTKGGIDTNTAATQLRGVFAALIKPGAEAQEVLDQYSIDVSQARIQTQGFASILAELRDKLGDNQAALARVVPDVRALTATFALVGKQAEEFRTILTILSSSSGATAAAFQKQLEAPANAVDRTLNRLSIGGEKYGSDIVNLLGSVVVSFEKQEEIVRIFASTFNRFSDDLEDKYTNLSKDISALLVLLNDTTTAVRQVTEAVSVLTNLPGVELKISLPGEDLVKDAQRIALKIAFEINKGVARASNVFVRGLSDLTGGTIQLPEFNLDLFDKAFEEFKLDEGPLQTIRVLRDKIAAAFDLEPISREAIQGFVGELDKGLQGALISTGRFVDENGNTVESRVLQIEKTFIDAQGSIKTVVRDIERELRGLVDARSFDAAAELATKVGSEARDARADLSTLRSEMLRLVQLDAAGFSTDFAPFAIVADQARNLKGEIFLLGGEFRRFVEFTRDAAGTVKAVFENVSTREAVESLKGFQTQVVRVLNEVEKFRDPVPVEFDVDMPNLPDFEDILPGPLRIQVEVDEDELSRANREIRDVLDLTLTPQLEGDEARRQFEQDVRDLQAFAKSVDFTVPGELPKTMQEVTKRIAEFLQASRDADELIRKLNLETVDSYDKKRAVIEDELDGLYQTIDLLARQGPEYARLSEAVKAYGDARRGQLDEEIELLAKKANAEERANETQLVELRRQARDTISQTFASLEGQIGSEIERKAKQLNQTLNAAADTINKAAFDLDLPESEIDELLRRLGEIAVKLTVQLETGDAESALEELSSKFAATRAIAVGPFSDVLKQLIELESLTGQSAKQLEDLAKKAGLADAEYAKFLLRLESQAIRRRRELVVDFALQPNVVIADEALQRAIEEQSTKIIEDFNAILNSGTLSADALSLKFEEVVQALQRLQIEARQGAEAFNTGFGARARDLYRQFSDDFVNGTQVADAAILGFTSNFSQAMTDLISSSKSAGEAFKEFVKNFILGIVQAINQIIAFKIAAAALRGLGFGLGGPGAGPSLPVGAGGEVLSTLAEGGVIDRPLDRFTSLPVKKYARGGIASSPQLAIFGEGRGAEAFVPLPGPDRGIPVEFRNSPGGGTGGGNNYSFYYEIKALDGADVKRVLEGQGKALGKIMTGVLEEGRVYALSNSVRGTARS